MAVRVGFLALALCLAAAPRAFAHRVMVFAWVEGAEVKVRANFGKRSRPARNCAVEVQGPDKEVLLRLRTDERGECSFRPPRKCNLLISVNAGEGHIGAFLLRKSELDGLEATGPGEKPVPPGGDASPSSSSGGKQAVPQLSAADLAAELRDIKAALRGIQRKLAEVEQSRAEAGRFQSVVNGLCALLGVVGAATLALYFARRRRENP